MLPLNVPPVAFIVPVISADDAVNAPAGVTLNGADANVECPSCMPSDPILIKFGDAVPICKNPSVEVVYKLVAPLDIELAPIVHPEMPH